jgi:hypothetical protein
MSVQKTEEGVILVTTGDPNYRPNEAASVPPNSDVYPSITGSGVDPTDTSTSQSTGDKVKEKASQVTDQAQQAASQATDRAQQQAKSQIATRKEQAVGNLTDVSQAVSQVGSQLRQNDHDTLAQYADMAAQQVNRVASYLRERNVNEILDEVQGAARRQPALFLAGAFALGVLGARFLKSSSPQSGSRYGTSGYYRQGDVGQYRGARTYMRDDGYGRPYGTTTRDWREAPSSTRTPRVDPGASYGPYDPDARELPR